MSSNKVKEDTRLVHKVTAHQFARRPEKFRQFRTINQPCPGGYRHTHMELNLLLSKFSEDESGLDLSSLHVDDEETAITEGSGHYGDERGRQPDCRKALTPSNTHS